MKKKLVLILSLIISIPFFTFSPSAASYELGTPVQFNKNYDLYSSVYQYDADVGRFVPSYYSTYGLMYNRYFSNNPNFTALIWSIGTRYTNYDTFPGYKDITGPTDVSQPCLQFVTPSDAYNKLFIPGITYEHLYLPSQGQYFKVEFSFTTQIHNIPDSSLISLDKLCFISDGLNDLSRTFSPSTITLNVRGQYRYDFTCYFNLSHDAISSMLDSDNVCLTIRIPYYFDMESSHQGAYVVSNATFPSSYEILTVGGYQEELDSIENAVVKGFDDLDSVLTDIEVEDVVFLDDAYDKFDTGKNVINDYNDANDEIRDIVEDIFVPDIGDIISNQVTVEDDIGSTIQDLMQNTYITSALLIVFSLCLISVILYGVRG